MSASGVFHWSKDFVEHLRAVHFALVVVSIAIIIGTTNDSERRNAAALTQITEIESFAKDWDRLPAKLWEQAVYQGHLESSTTIFWQGEAPDFRDWQGVITLHVPRKFSEEFGGYGDLPMRTRIGEQVLAESVKKQLDYRQLPKPLTLSDFRSLWDRIHTVGLRFALPLEPDGFSKCVSTVEFTRVDGSKKMSDGGSCKYGFDSGTTEFSGFKSTATIALAFNGMGRDLLVIHTDLPVDKGRSPEVSSLKSTLFINVKLQEFRMNETCLSFGYSDWRQGDFESAFPELSDLSSGISDLDLAEAVNRIKVQAAAGGREISILGLSVPIAQVSQWGAVILLSVQIYFWLHLHELVMKIAPAAEGWDVAWIGLYTTRVSYAVAILSTCFLPVAAALTLLKKVFSSIPFDLTVSETAYHHGVRLFVEAALMVIVSLVIGTLTMRKLYQLRKLARQASMTQSNIDPV